MDEILYLASEQLDALRLDDRLVQAVYIAGGRVCKNLVVAAATDLMVGGLHKLVVVVGMLVYLEAALADGDILVVAGSAEIVWMR